MKPLSLGAADWTTDEPSAPGGACRAVGAQLSVMQRALLFEAELDGFIEQALSEQAVVEEDVAIEALQRRILKFFFSETLVGQSVSIEALCPLVREPDGKRLAAAVECLVRKGMLEIGGTAAATISSQPGQTCRPCAHLKARYKFFKIAKRAGFANDRQLGTKQ